MKKNILFLMTVISLFMFSRSVHASSNDFYHAERIEGVFTKSVGQITKYQTARFFRRISDNQAVYCMEPFIVFSDSSSYTSQITTPSGLDDETWKKISLLAYYGYGYGNHTDPKWYAVTQVLIWREVDKNADFFFTDVLDGSRIEAFNNEINEMNSLVNEHYKDPSFKNKTINVKKGTKYIYDDNNVIKRFVNSDNILKIDNNRIDISDLDVGSYDFSFERNLPKENGFTTFYYSDTSQNFVTRGSLPSDSFKLHINIYDTEIKVEKIDKDTNSTKSSGDGKLCNCTFGIYNEDMLLIKEIKADDNCTATITNLDLGKYYIKELSAGDGYNINDTLYTVDLSLQNNKVVIEIPNKIIEKTITIHKDYGNEQNMTAEEHVIFDIYSHDNYITSVTTDLNGNTSITLPYGEYVFKQITSKDGYQKVDDFNVKVEDNDISLKYDLLDYVIKVPDTRSDKKDYNLFFDLIILLSLIYVKKICYI